MEIKGEIGENVLIQKNLLTKVKLNLKLISGYFLLFE